ncbi:hypothetical protein BJY52DRAFT_1374563 [Lactarius psammicola]|nr:hypothetical protein BJY52DRAFT_1374563 [Lactarius psammicola]
MAEACPLTQEHAELLATKWWTGENFKRYGVPCCEGPFAQAETDRIEDAIRGYQETHGMSQEDMEDLVLSTTRHSGFWAHACPFGLRPRSARHPFRKPGKWTELDDARLKEFAEQCLKWERIGDLLERPADECRHRYRKHLEHCDTQCKGKWSLDEELRLNLIMQDMNVSGQNPQATSKFWKEVSKRMDNTRTAKQCSNKWNDSLSPTVKSLGRPPRWREADSCILVHKIASLNFHAEDEIRWDNLTWSKWSTEKLQKKWVTLKDKVHTPNATHHDVVQRLITRFSTPSALTST